MKIYWKLLAFGIVAVALCVVLVRNEALAQPAPATAVATTRMAVCDIVEVFNRNQKAKDVRNVLEEKRKSVAAENETRSKAIDAKRMDLAAYKEDSPQYEKTLQDMQRMGMEHKIWMEMQNAALLREHRRYTKQLYEEILAVVAQVAQQRGIDVVLYVEREVVETEDTRELLTMIERRKVLYANDRVDFTETVLARLNEAYRAAKDQ